MKKLTLLLLVSTLSLSAQKNDSAAEKPKEDPQWVVDIKALSQEARKEYGQSAQRSKLLFDQKRIFECLAEIRKLETIYDKNPAILNLRGACYVEFRNFEKAQKAFDTALGIQAGDFNVRFNVAEIKFVSKRYKEALKDLEELHNEALETPNLATMIPLIEFKIILCKLKLKDVAGAKAIVDATDFLSDSPLYFYGNAALEYNADRGAEAEEWLARGRRVFKSPQIIAPWQDTLIEFGYLKSFYGGDLEVESGPPTGETPTGE